MRNTDSREGRIYTITEILRMAKVKYSIYPGCAAGNIYLTDANQLIGTYKDLEAYRRTDRNYAGWHAHHVLEDDDLNRLGVRNHAPSLQ